MPDETARMTLPVGAQIRDLRKARGMTIQALADTIGRSVGYVSQIERNISAVSIPVLDEIARALGVGINWFFQNSAETAADEHGIVVRRANRRRLDFANTGMVEELLSPGFSGAFEIIMGGFAPGAESAASRADLENGRNRRSACRGEIPGPWSRVTIKAAPFSTAVSR